MKYENIDRKINLKKMRKYTVLEKYESDWKIYIREMNSKIIGDKQIFITNDIALEP